MVFLKVSDFRLSVKRSIRWKTKEKEGLKLLEQGQGSLDLTPVWLSRSTMLRRQ
jgi:hypothetical protein